MVCGVSEHFWRSHISLENGIKKRKEYQKKERKKERNERKARKKSMERKE
jgi:hypothetical protein